MDELFPRALINNAVMREWLIKCGDTLGCRWENFVYKGIVKEDGSISWNEACPYSMVFNKEGKVVGVKHDLLNRDNQLYGVVDETAQLDPSWTLFDIFDDRAAYASKRMAKPKLHEFFTDEQQKQLHKYFDAVEREQWAKSIKARITSTVSQVEKLEEDILKKGALKAKQDRSEKAKARRAFRWRFRRWRLLLRRALRRRRKSRIEVAFCSMFLHGGSMPSTI
jgi:hypothetical protein